MPRRNRLRNSYCQKSKRARTIKKMSIFSGLNKNFSHPSHISGTQRVIYSVGYKSISKKRIDKILRRKIK